ncbi:MAG: RNA polymerase sigma factor [Planctomycetota bacterium]
MTQDIDVIHKVLQGDTDSFGVLVTRYKKPVIALIRNMSFSPDSSEDIAQDIFFIAYRKLASFDPVRSRFSTWLFTIARNKAINALKKKRPVFTNSLLEKTDTRKPSDNIEQQEFFNELDRQLQALPGRQKRAFILAEFEKLPYEQIAQIEGVKIGTVKSRINRAKNRLRSALAGLDGEII